jgi:hypothetical protein
MSQTLRKYQVELANQALSTNIIVWLGTGSGKTIIAALVIKKVLNQLLSEDNVIPPYNQDEKLTIENVFNLNYTFDSNNLNVLETLESNDSINFNINPYENFTAFTNETEFSCKFGPNDNQKYPKKIIFLAPQISLAEQQSKAHIYTYTKYIFI